MSQHQVYTLPPIADAGAGAEPEPLRDQIERGLLGTPTPTVPGDTLEDQQWAFKRSVPTVVLYSEHGLRLYDEITAKAPEYYLFEDELNLFKTHGHEIARAMGFPGREHSQVTLRGGTKSKHDDGNHHNFPPAKPWKPARWGDTEVGKWNDGVNGEEGLAGGWKRGWDVVELGAGALRKTAHLLTALADNLPPPPADLDTSDTPPPIAYHALDLSKPELDRVLGQMEESYGDVLNGRVSCVGLHGDYFAGLEFVRSGGLDNLTTPPPEMTSTPSMSNNSTHSDPSDGSSPDLPASPQSALLVTPAADTVNLPHFADDDVPSIPQLGASMTDDVKWSKRETAIVAPSSSRGSNKSESTSDSRRPLHIIFLGSSLGNFERNEAAPFLHQLPLQPGDALLLGLDGRPAPGPEGRKKVELAYNDPSGHTRAFEEHGWAVALQELGLEPDTKGVEFVGRYNETLGRHEAYLRSKTQQTIPLPSGKKVELTPGELLHVEWSYKYSLSETLDLFDQADLRVINSWKAPDSEYRLWLLERPAVRFTERSDAKETAMTPKLPRAIPTWNEWESLWSLWDHITLSMIPREMLHTKPIDLRHICLFYLGHIPTFLDIYLSRITDGSHTHPTFKDIFERGIDPDVDDPTKIHAHSEVPTREEDWPALPEIVAFRDAVRRRLKGVYDDMERMDGGVPRHTARSIFMTFEHEAMHAETLLYMLLQSPMTVPPGPEPQWEALAAQWETLSASAAANGANTGLIEVRATTVTLGHNDAEPNDANATLEPEHEFGWDNEHPEHKVAVKPFKASALPITNGEYLAFMNSTHNAKAPASWVEVDGEYCVRTLFGPVPFKYAAKWPLMASRDEINAFAAFKGGRLPTEAELRALWAHPEGPRPDAKAANIGFKNWHPVPPMPTMKDNAGTVLHGHNGGVWEWTSTQFEGHPGFIPSELYPGYSADFFDGKHWVVLGGSFATIPQIAHRKSFRNWYQGNYRFAWIGGRVVYDA